MTSFAAGFVHTSQGTKYQWGSEITVPITGKLHKNHGSSSERTRLCVPDGFRRTAPGITPPIQASSRRHHEDQRQWSTTSTATAVSYRPENRSFNGQTHTFTKTEPPTAVHMFIQSGTATEHSDAVPKIRGTVIHKLHITHKNRMPEPEGSAILF